MRKKRLLILGGALLILGGGVVLFPYLRVHFAKIEVVLVDDLTVAFADKKPISSYVRSLNGKIVTDKLIDTTKLGKHKETFSFVNDDGIKVSYSFTVTVVDTVEPLIWLGNRYTITKGSIVDFSKTVLCGDNADKKPKCYVEGDYDVDTVGEYSLIYKAEDASGNIAEQPFVLRVVEPKSSGGSSGSSGNVSRTDFADVFATYKNDHTRLGIDVSHWQGDIDFEKVKKAGVEFVIIRVGGTRGTDGEYFVDEKFEQNIKEANRLGIDVGLYFYSYANSDEHAKRDAEWLLKQIKNYKVTLPIAFDWEDWGYFNNYELSFFGLTSMADTFLNTIEKAGYDGMLYSSKSYLEKIWLPLEHDIWLAHYTDQTTYQGDYLFWQLCDDGKVDGINGAVDINIMNIK